MHIKCRYYYLSLYILCCFLVRANLAFNNLDEFDTTTISHSSTHARKDRILFKDVTKLIFQRNKRTTSRRTHSIHQLTCVGGTAGCKLFTPNIVECEKLNYNIEKSKYDWRCHAEISDRVVFNHVEVICEGYEYPEDDYILLGSCGLEFTLDYADPQDYHHNSYFRHMDEHEKEMHKEKVKERTNSTPLKPSLGYLAFFVRLVDTVSSNITLVSVLLLLVICLFLVIKFFASATNTQSIRRYNSSRGSAYGPLASAVLTTKKAC